MPSNSLLIIRRRKLGHEFPPLVRAELIITAAVRHESLKSPLARRRVAIDQIPSIRTSIRGLLLPS